MPVIEYIHPHDRRTTIVSGRGLYADISFVAQPRYCGARARDITNDETVRQLHAMHGFRVYDGPILDFVPEDATTIDWGRFRAWVESLPDSERSVALRALGVEAQTPDSPDDSNDSPTSYASATSTPHTSKRRPRGRTK